MGFDAESEGCESGANGAVTESEAVREGFWEEDMVVEGIDRGVKVTVEKLDCLSWC